LDTSREFWQIAHNWLLLCGNKISKNYCREEITSHSNYPALISLIDFLDSGRMNYKAVKADTSHFNDFNYPLLAHIRIPGQEYMQIIKDVDFWFNEKEIVKYWSGIVVYPEKSAIWKNKDNDTYNQNEKRKKVINVTLITISVLLLLFSAYYLSNIQFVLLGILSLLGLIISLFLLGKELGFQSHIVKKVCGAVSNGGCEHVLKSPYAKGFAGITPADASVLYFVTQYVIYLIGCWYPILFKVIISIAFSGIAVSAWSIYTQAVKIKRYCALCLSIVIVLLAQSVIAFTLSKDFLLSAQLKHSNSIYLAFGFFLSIYLFFALFLLPIKQLIKTNYTNKIKLVEFKKWKTDINLFIQQWQLEQEVDNTIWKNDLLLGKLSAPLLITVACNPYCEPCAQAHKKLDTLLYRFENKVKVQIRLLCNTENENDKKTVAVKAILQSAAIHNNNNDLQRMVTDWFEWLDYEKWKAKWTPDSTIDITKRIQQHEMWFTKSGVGFTPTFYINGKQLPRKYELEDIEILIPQLAEMMDIKKNTNN